MSKIRPCDNCGRETNCELYAYDTRYYRGKLSYFCTDCWVIIYGEGRYTEQNE
jgi:hypothetical protein